MQSAIAHTSLEAGADAGQALGMQIREQLNGARPDALILFASARYDYVALLKALDATCEPRVLVGCSSAGEFTTAEYQEGSACAVALRSEDMQFTAAVGKGLRTDRDRAAHDLAAGFRGPSLPQYPYRSALVLTDALAGYANELVERLTTLTAGSYQFFGGGAGDDARFAETHVFYGTEALTDTVVALEILSQTPLGIGVRHGWEPATAPLRVTESRGLQLVSLNAAPAVEAFAEHADRTAQAFDATAPMPFFLHNVMGTDTGQGYRLTVPLALTEDGAIVCAADVAEGGTTHIMQTTAQSAVDAARDATVAALRQLQDGRPHLALVFDCVATRLRTGRAFDNELRAIADTLGDARFAGCNTYGQIARAEGQFSGFHNCTAVVCIIPE